VRVLTWNVLGAAAPDVGRLASVIASFEPDVVALQEVRRRQAHEISRRLGDWQCEWRWKHATEGLAVVARFPMKGTSVRVLRHRPPWDWRRRIAVDTHLVLGHVQGAPVRMLDVHLTPHGDERARSREANRLVDLVLADDASAATCIIVGDLNEEAGEVLERFAGAGLVDAWSVALRPVGPTGGATNWTAGPRKGRPPTQRLDHVVVGAGWEVVGVEVPGGGASSSWSFDELAELSDHLPLVVELRRRVTG
jgi:endonuclease/exonuclease/phosphatase family metal-dependent hydrolase